MPPHTEAAAAAVAPPPPPAQQQQQQLAKGGTPAEAQERDGAVAEADEAEQ